MAGLTKKDIKEVVLEVIEPLAKTVQGEFQRMGGRLDRMEQGLDRVESELNELKEILRNFMSKVDELITIYRKQEMELASLASHVARLEKRIEALEKRK